jgi:uncharacterized protein
MSLLDQLKNHKYLNLETFRKSGVGVKTPVWFAMDNYKIYIQTGANTGKVKRIRNNEYVNIASCKMDGKLNGSWIPAQAREITEPEICLEANRLLGRKYGILKKVFESQRTKKGTKDIILEISFSE